MVDFSGGLSSFEQSSTSINSHAPLPVSVRLSELRQVPISGPVASTSFAFEMNELALSERLAEGRHRRGRGNDMQIRAVRNDLIFRNRRW